MKSFLTKLKKTGLIAILLLPTSCATYHITNESFIEQTQAITPTEGMFTFTTGGLFLFRKILNNGIRELVVMNKKGEEKRIRVTQRTSIRIHTKDGKYQTFYFDTLFIHDNTIVGQKTHFFPMAIKPIPIEDIVKIELQR